MAPPPTAASGTTTDPVLAAGVVLWSGSVEQPRFLLLQNSLHQTWGLSKGHLNSGEELIAGALRETEEETGYVLTAEDLRGDFSDTSIYQPKEGLWKRVVNFLAAQPVDIDALQVSDEHQDVRWLALEEALQIVEHDALRRTLIRAAYRLNR